MIFGLMEYSAGLGSTEYTGICFLWMYVNTGYETTIMDTFSNKLLTITSFNCKGVMGSSLYVDNLLKDCDILLLQEHHLFERNADFIGSINVNFEHRTKCSSYVSFDFRPIRQGGVSILWRKNMSLSVKPLNTVDDFCQVLQITKQGYRTLYIINVYLPSANHPYHEFDKALQTVKDLYHYYEQSRYVFMCGDFNVHVADGPRSITGSPADPRRSRI